mmetsp:Transcript_20529/g.40344  ORF Transcript_20529/g.40344 Transcript_20529/m.40344 type:complete len:153 (-) Transcript_20529:3589-4047(-)
MASSDLNAAQILTWVSVALVAVGTAWLAREQLAWAGRMAWDGDLEGRKRARAKAEHLQRIVQLRLRAEELRQEYLQPLVDETEANSDVKHQEEFQLRVNGAETKLLEVFYVLDAVRGDEDIVKARKDAVKWINGNCMGVIDRLREVSSETNE